MKKIIKIAILVFVLAVIVAGSGYFIFQNRAKKTGREKFTISIVSWVGYAPLYLAKDRGYFAEEGVDVDVVVINDTAQRKITIAKGDIQGLGDTIDMLVLAREENVPAVAVMEIDASNGADGILVTDKIKSLADLRGQKIAVQKNFVSESLLNYILKTNGIPFKDVQTVDTEAGAAGAAFVAGKYDVAVTYEPWLSKAKERQGGRVIASSADVPGVIIDVFSVNSGYLKAHPETVKKVMRGWFKAVKFWQENPQEANAIMAKYYQESPEAFAENISGLVWPDYEGNLAYFGTPENPGRIYEVAKTFTDIFEETGQIKTRPDMMQGIDSSLLKQLYD